MIAFLALLVMWAGLFGRAMVKHLIVYRSNLLTTDYLSVLACIGVLAVMALIFGGDWDEISLKERFALHPQRTLAFLILGTACIVFYYYITGIHFYMYEDIGTDLKDDYMPIIAMVIGKLKAHDFALWTANWGLGVDILNAQSTVCDIFNIPVYIAGVLVNLEAALFVLPFMHILKCYLSGLFCYKFLDQFRLGTSAKVIAAYLCAFNGFIMLWGQHYFFSSVVVWMMLVFWQIERYLRGRNNQIALTLSIALIGISSLYMTYMAGIAAAIYTLFRLFYMSSRENKGELTALAGKTILCVITGLMLTAFITFPVYYQLTFVSSRLDEASSLADTLKQYLTAFHSREQMGGILLRLFSNNLSGVGSYYRGTYNYYEQAQYYFSYMGAILVLMYYVERILHSKKKIFHTVGLLMTLYAVFMPMTAIIFNKFVSIGFRYTLVMIPMFAYAAAYIFTNLKKLHPATLIVGWIASAAGAVFIMMKSREYVRLYDVLLRRSFYTYAAVIMILLMVSMLLLTVGRAAVRFEKAAVLCVGALMVFHAAYESYTTIDGYRYVSVNGVQTTENQRSALNREFWMVPRGFGRATEAALAKIDLPAGSTARTEMAYSDVSRWNDSMIHDFMGYSYYNTSYNRYAESFVRSVWGESSIIRGYASFADVYDNAQLASLLNIEYVLCSDGRMENVEGYEKISGDTGISVYRNSNAPGLGILFDQVISWESFNALSVEEKREILGNAIVLGEGAPVEELEKTDDWAGYYTANGVQFTKGDDEHFRGTVTCDHPRYLMISIPYDEGWTVTVDGEKVNTMVADLGFTGIMVDAGEHQVSLTYHTPWLDYGVTVSMAGAALMVIQLLFRALAKRKAEKRGENI